MLLILSYMRYLLYLILLLVTLSQFTCTKPGNFAKLISKDTTQNYIDTAHAVIWRRFISNYNTMYEYTGLDGSIYYPTSQECKQGIPSQLGWGTSIDNGALFGGL